MVSVTTEDVLTETQIRRVIEEEREYPLLFNEAFERIDMPDDYPSKTIELPVDSGAMAEPERIGPSGEYPSTEEDVEKQSVTVEKHGFKVPIEWEAIQFSVFDVVARQTEKAARRFNEYINRLAFNEMDDANNQHPSSTVQPGDTGVSSGFDWGLLTYCKKLMKDEQLNPDTLVVNTEGELQLANSDNFQRASDLGDEVVREGMIGRIAQIDVMVDNSGLMPSNTAAGYLLDTNEYGYEVVKEDITTTEYEDKDRDAQIVKWRTMRNWHVVNPEAAVYLTE